MHQELVSGKSQGTACITYLMWDIRAPYDGCLLFSNGTRQINIRWYSTIYTNSGSCTRQWLASHLGLPMRVASPSTLTEISRGEHEVTTSLRSAPNTYNVRILNITVLAPAIANKGSLWGSVPWLRFDYCAFLLSSLSSLPCLP